MIPIMSITDLTHQRVPDFNNLLAVLQRRKPSRPVLFEFGPAIGSVMKIPGTTWLPDTAPCGAQRNFFEGHRLLGYDYSIAPVWPYKLISRSLGVRTKQQAHPDARGISLNEGASISDEASFERFVWPTHNEAEFARMADMKPYVPEGMKLVFTSGSMEEGVIQLTGYDNLCYLMYDAPELVQAIADKLGAILVQRYTLALQHDFFGACLQSDDWGFKTQLLLPPEFLRRYIIPWHKKIAAIVHAAGRPMILHSCGQLETIMDDIIDVCKYDAKHSYEDTITPVEEAYDRWGKRIAILGGIDVDFLCRRTPAEIFARSRALIEKTGCVGYALGSGNSIPDYVPLENYFAMNKAALIDEPNLR